MLVIKIGGGAAIGNEAFGSFAADLATITEPVVVVHGGNAELSRLCERLGMPPVMVTSSTGRVSRYTDADTMDAMLMAYAGKVNKRLVAAMRGAGVNAVGLSAMDGGIATGHRKPMLRGEVDGRKKVLLDDHAGTIDAIDPTVIRALMAAGFVALVTPPALDLDEGVPINVDGDKLAQKLAESLGADSLLFFSDTPGLLADRHDETSLIHEIDAGDPASALAVAEGRMVVKVEQAVKAVEHGVGQVVFSDARAERPVSRALAGQGTVIRRTAVPT